MWILDFVIFFHFRLLSDADVIDLNELFSLRIIIVHS